MSLKGSLYRQTRMSRVMRKPVFRISDRSHTNRAVQPQKKVRGLKFRIKKVKELYVFVFAKYSLNSCAADLPGPLGPLFSGSKNKI